MRIIQKIMIITVLLHTATAQLSFAQYFMHVHDVDSLYNWGWCIASKPDNTFMAFGWSENKKYGLYSIFNMNISSDGSNVLSMKELRADSCTFANGDQGQVRATVDGGFIAPYVKQWPNPVTGYLYSAAGIVKYNAFGDTVFTRMYTDTSIYFDIMFACAVMPNGDYIIGGVHALNVPSYSPAYVIRLNSAGDTIWTHTYQKNIVEGAKINTLEALPNGHILVGAMSIHQEYPFWAYDCRAPWFMELDSAGTIVKDTLYSKGYVYRGDIGLDKQGGYFHIGAFDSLKTKFPVELPNFPNYFAHLDTNFRIQWITDFGFSSNYGHRYTSKAIQLHDGNFVVAGSFFGEPSNTEGWAAKLDRNGTILWSHNYTSDSTRDAYFRDVIEKPNGDLVFIGIGFSDTLPSWHNDGDLWIVGTDSNGCVMAGGCDPDTGTVVTFVPAVQKQSEPLSIFPNPTTGTLNVRSTDKGKLLVYTITGQLAVTYTIQSGNTELQLPATISTGVYLCRYVPDDGSKPQSVLRLVYER